MPMSTVTHRPIFATLHTVKVSLVESREAIYVEASEVTQSRRRESKTAAFKRYLQIQLSSRCTTVSLQAHRLVEKWVIL